MLDLAGILATSYALTLLLTISFMAGAAELNERWDTAQDLALRGVPRAA